MHFVESFIMQRKKNKIHSLMLATAVALDEENVMANNLRGTLKDKLNVETFCYNIQKYRLHQTIQLSEESAYRVRVKPTRLIDYDPENEELKVSENQGGKGSVKEATNQKDKRSTFSRIINMEISDMQGPKSGESPDSLDDLRLANLSDSIESGCPSAPKPTFQREALYSATQYYPVNDSTKQFIKNHIERKTKKKLMAFFNACQQNEHCVLFMTGHGKNDGTCLFLNIEVDAYLTFDDVVQLWNCRKALDEVQDDALMESHLLIIVDACYLGKWAYRLEHEQQFRNVTDVSVQASSNKDQTSQDAGSDSGGYFLNNLLYLNGMRDLVYINNYKQVHSITGKKVDSQTPTFFSRFRELEVVFRLKVGFNDWEDMEWRVRSSFKGTFVGENGEMIKGEFKSIQLHGMGTKQLANGRVESGCFKNDNLEGQGVIEWNGLVCQGTFENGRLTDDFVATLSDGTTLPELGLMSGCRSGRKLIVENDMVVETRRLNRSDRDRVVYEWVKTQFNSSKGSEGQCRDQKRHGFNIKYSQNRVKLVGIWDNGVFRFGVKAEEEGRLRLKVREPKSVFLKQVVPDMKAIVGGSGQEGHWREDHGKSRLLLMEEVNGVDFWKYWNRVEDSDSYQKGNMEFRGRFVEGKPSGFGLLVIKDGLNYEGFWAQGLPQGQGNYYDSSKSEAYSGFWEKGRRHGKGRMVFADKECYEGNWQHDRGVGWGKLTLPNGGCWEGFFVLRSDELGAEVSKSSSMVSDLLFAVSGKYRRLSDYDRLKAKCSEELSQAKGLRKTLSANSTETKKALAAHDKLQNYWNSWFANDPPAEFEGTVWKGTYFGLCKLGSETGSGVVGEFFDGKLLLRDKTIEKKDYKFSGDLLAEGFGLKGLLEQSNQAKVKVNVQRIRPFMHGYGRVEKKVDNRLEVFEGLFYCNERAGSGKMTVARLTATAESALPVPVKESLYEGEFYGNSVICRVRMAFKDKSVYNGLCLMDRILWANQPVPNVYQCDWTNLRKFGFGTHERTASGTYKGMFFDNKREGFGILTNQKFRYEGEFANNHRNGRGRCWEYDSNTTYEGEFRMGKRHGSGWLVTENQLEYKGQFENDGFSGRGELKSVQFEEQTAVLGTDSKKGVGCAEFIFETGHPCGFTMAKTSGEVWVGRLRRVLFSQLITVNSEVEVVENYTLGLDFKFDDFTTVTAYLEVKDRKPLKLVVRERQPKQLSNERVVGADKKGWSEFELEITGDRHEWSRAVSDELQLDISWQWMACQQIVVSIRKVLFLAMEYRVKMSDKNYLEFNFTRNSREIYSVTVFKKQGVWESLVATRKLMEVYVGDFLRGEKSGSGCMVMVDGSVYTGQIKRNLFEGEGVLRLASGGEFVGGFKNGLKEGNGSMSWPNGQSFKGYYREGKENGFGLFMYSSDFFYQGTFKDGKQDGQGLLHFKDRWQYEGQFKEGFLHGVGVMTKFRGRTYQGRFEYNHFVVKHNRFAFEDGSVVSGQGCFALIDFVKGEKHTDTHTVDRTQSIKQVDSGHFYIFATSQCDDDDDLDSDLAFRHLTGECEVTFGDGRKSSLQMAFGCGVGNGAVQHVDGSEYVGQFLMKFRKTGAPVSCYTIDQRFEFHAEHGWGVFEDKGGNLLIGSFEFGQFRHGIVAYSNSDMYFGSMNDGKRTGKGELRLANGDMYQGIFVDDKRSGFGLLKGKGLMYVGEFQNDVFHGFGELRTSDMKHYCGQFVNGKMHGEGRYQFNENDYYLGSFENGLIQGFGVIKGMLGREVSEGEFVEGKKSGYGEMVVDGFWSYKGEFLNDRMHGYGQLLAESIDYKGEFENSLFHGNGILKLKNSVYEGGFARGLKEGLGKQVTNTGLAIQGMFKLNRLNGIGQLENEGETKVCEFAQSKIVKRVQKILDRDGRKYSGECLVHPKRMESKGSLDIVLQAEGQFDKHGKGVLIFDDGYSFEGTFENDMVVKAIDCFDCVFTKLTVLDLINGLLFFKPKDAVEDESGCVNEKELVANLDINSLKFSGVRSDLFEWGVDASDSLNNIGAICSSGDMKETELSDHYLHIITPTSPASSLQSNSQIDSHPSSINDHCIIPNDPTPNKSNQRSGKPLLKVIRSLKPNPEFESAHRFYSHFEPVRFDGLFDPVDLSRIKSYKGQFKNGMWNNFGKLTYLNGDEMEGMFKRFKMHKHGIKRFKDGSFYEGFFRNSRFEGQGTLTFPNKIVYNGWFTNDKMEGCGTLTIPGLSSSVIQVRENLIIHSVEEKQLQHDIVYSGQCLMKLKTNMNANAVQSFDDCLEYVMEYGKGTYWQKNTYDKRVKTLVEGKVNSVEENLKDGTKLSRIENTSLSFQVQHQKFTNGISVIGVYNEELNDLRMIRFGNDYWFVGAFQNKKRTGLARFKVNGEAHQSAEEADGGERTNRWLMFRRDEML
jgi:hypothetical protein